MLYKTAVHALTFEHRTKFVLLLPSYCDTYGYRRHYQAKISISARDNLSSFHYIFRGDSTDVLLLFVSLSPLCLRYCRPTRSRNASRRKIVAM